MDATRGLPPAVTDETASFWATAAEGRLVVERCLTCGADSFPPRGMCRNCRGRSMSSVEVTGRGRVYSFTVNYQRWLPDLDVPYAIVLVEFPDHPGVRVVGPSPGRRPAAGRHRDGGRGRIRARTGRLRHPELRGGRGTRLMGSERFEARVVISGIGQSAIGREVHRSGFQLALDAVLAGVADAGLSVDDIDGLAMFPGGSARPTSPATPTATSTRSTMPSASPPRGARARSRA